MVTFNLFFSEEVSQNQKQATIHAAEILGGHLTDDIVLDLHITATDKLETNVSAAAFPLRLGGIDYERATQPLWADRKVYFEEADFISFEEYYEALVADNSGFGRDETSLQNLASEVRFFAGADGNTVSYFDNFNQWQMIRGLEVTSANSKAVGLNRETGNSDGIIAFNSLDRYGSAQANPAISEYRELQTYSDTEYQGNLAFINTSVDREGYLRGKFSLVNGKIIDMDGDGELDIAGDLNIVSFQEYSDRVVYFFKSNDTTFFNNEKNQVTFNAEKLDTTNPFSAVNYTSLYNYEEVGVSISQKPYSIHNPYEQSVEELTDLAIHEIGHILGITSVTDEIPEEYGDRILDSADLELSPEDNAYRYAQSHDLTPFDLYRYQETNDGQVRRSLNPNVENTGSFFSHDRGQETRIKLSEGKHISTDYLIDIYEIDQGAAVNPYLADFAHNGGHQGSHFRNQGAFSAVHTRDDGGHGLAGQDLTALDVIGWDIRNDGSYQLSQVNVYDGIDDSVLPDLEYALYRSRTTTTTSKRDAGTVAENGTEAETIDGFENADLGQDILDSFI